MVNEHHVSNARATALTAYSSRSSPAISTELGRCEAAAKATTNVPRTNANSAATNDDDVLCGLEPFLPLGHELTNVGVVFWEIDRTSPFGPGCQYKDCENQMSMCTIAIEMYDAHR